MIITSTANPPASGDVQAIQILRAAAALSICLVHFQLMSMILTGHGTDPIVLFPLGAGVDLFFVISGFVMVYSSEALFGAVGAPKKFLGRRIARIVPLYWATTLIVVILKSNPISLSAFVKSYLFIPYQTPSGTFEPLSGVGWTLNFEMFFYVVFAAALMLRREAAVVVASSIILGVIAVGQLAPSLPKPLRFWSDPIAIEFIFGMMLAVAYRRGLRLPRWIGGVLLLGGATAAWYGVPIGVPSHIRWLECGVPATAIFAGLVMQQRLPDKVRWLGALGDASYSIYLIHPIVIATIFLCWPNGLTPLGLALVTGGGFITTIALSLVVFRWFEKPVTRAARRAASWRPRETISTAYHSLSDMLGQIRVVRLSEPAGGIGEGDRNETSGRRKVGGLIAPIICCIALIVDIELAVQLALKPTFWDRSTWLTFEPYRGETFDRVEAFDKLNQLVDTDPDIISVGDSSGFFSLQSKIINRYVKPLKYINLSTGANHAFAGYEAMARYMLEHSRHVKYVVLYMYPQLLPEDKVVDQGDLGDILYADIIGPKSYLTPPSAALSPYIKSAVFNGAPYDPSAPLSSHEPTVEFANSARYNLGWLHEYDERFDQVFGRISFYPDRREHWYDRLIAPSAIHDRLNHFNDMVRSHGAQLIIAFAPLPKTIFLANDPNIAVAQIKLADFQREHPDVKFLFPLLTPFGPEKFGQFNHLAYQYSFISSARLGKALGKFLSDPSSIPPFAARPPEPIDMAGPATIGPSGSPDPALRDAAMALYLYAATGDVKYRRLITSRVLEELDNDHDFQYHLQDTRDRIDMFSGKMSTLGYDISQLSASTVAVTGIPFCRLQPDTLWVQISGTISFNYNSPTLSLREPVPWSQKAHILVPTRLEDGIQKFDGYCPEPSQKE